MDFRKELANVNRYRVQLRKLFDKLKVKGQLFDIQQEEVEFFNFGLHEAQLSKILRNAVLNENYYLQPALERTLLKNNKSRKMYIFPPTDKIVIAVLIKILFDLAEQLTSANLYSYRPGMTILQPVSKLSHYLQQQLAQHRGIYVFKTDISNYSEHIRLDAQSRLWLKLQQLFDQCSTSQPTAYQWQLIQSCFRPVYRNNEGLLMANILGTPMGVVSSTLACNLYAADIDEQMQRFEPLFYARYSDDIILAHPELDVIEPAITQLQNTIAELGLTAKSEKEERLYVNPGAYAKEPWRGCNKLTYLGHDIYGTGHFLISTKRQHKFLRAVTRRIQDTAKVLRKHSVAQKGLAICKAVNAALVDKNFAELETTHLVAGNHQAMLRHLDYQIALRIAEAITEQTGARAFRKIPYKMIRQDWQLLSLARLAYKH